MIDTTKLRELAQKAKCWSNCTESWPHEDLDGIAVIGHICEDGNKYDVATIDTGQYYAEDDAIPLAAFYAAANPATVLALLDDLQALREDLNDARNGWERAAQDLNEAGQCIANQCATIGKLQQIEAAARNLAKVKGRHNSELAMNQLLESLK